ncbi:MAG: allophanate hydrolase [Verrucomicrobiota bacterium]
MTESFDIVSLQAGYQREQFSVEDVMGEVQARCDEAPETIWIHRCSSSSIEKRVADLVAMKRSGATLPLYGIPFAIKDNIDLAGIPTSAGCPDFAYTPSVSSTVVDRLCRAGAIPIGKTNLDQFATGLVGVRSPFGVPGNAFDPAFIPGGSSSGSAVAVALSLVSFALGTDTAGSGRVPAALNNLVGYKPTRGLLSNAGVVPACRTLDCVSIFSFTAHDADIVRGVAAGQDSRDPFSRPPGTAPGLPGRLRVAVPREEDLEFFGNRGAKQCFEEACDSMKALGAFLVPIDFGPFEEVARLLYEGPWIAERYAAIREFLESDPEIHPVTAGIIGQGMKPSAADAFEAFYRLESLRQEVGHLWNLCHCLITPTVGTTYRISEVENDPIQLNSNLGHYTNFMNLLDMAAVAVPAGRMDHDQPFGVTLSAPGFSDLPLLELADDFHSASGLNLGRTEFPVAAAQRLQKTDGPVSSCHLAVCGAHLRDLPLHFQLKEIGAEWVEKTVTAPEYRLFCLPKSEPLKPGLLRVEKGGQAIEVEVYRLSPEAFGRFVAAIPEPLGIGKIKMENGEFVSGFLCESWALEGAEDVTRYGGWRAYLGSLEPS